MRLAEMANFVAARGIPGAAHRVNLCSWRKMRGTPSGKRVGGILPGGGTGDKSGLAGAQASCSGVTALWQILPGQETLPRGRSRGRGDGTGKSPGRRRVWPHKGKTNRTLTVL